MPRQLLVDADVLIYASAFAAQKTRYVYLDKQFEDAEQAKAYCAEHQLDYRQLRKDGEITSYLEVLPEGAAKMIFRQKLAAICNACGSDQYKLIVSGDGNYRDEIAKTRGYKANRATAIKPQHYVYIRSVALDDSASELTVGIEADDAMGIYMTRDSEAVICTIDKDLNMLPGRHYNWDKGIRYRVEEVDAQRAFLTQLLTGDTTDNIPGIPGCGEKGAAAIIEPHRGNVRAMWQAVKAEHYKGPFTFKDGSTTGDPSTYLNEQGCLLWIRRKKEELWNADYYEKEYVK